MNRLTPWFDALDHSHRPVISMDVREQTLVASKLFRIDTACEPDPTPLDRTSTGEPIAVRLPEPYEPKYAYPLIVWLHGDDGDETEIETVLPGMSEQNYVGVGLRGAGFDIARPHARPWDTGLIEEWLPTLHTALVDLRRSYHVHSERIFLAGRDAGAAMAIESLLHRPEWFAGALALPGAISLRAGSLARFRNLRDKRLLLTSTTDDVRPGSGIVDAITNAATARQLRAAGMDVDVRTYDGGPFSSELLRDANRWLVEAACTTV